MVSAEQTEDSKVSYKCPALENIRKRKEELMQTMNECNELSEKIANKLNVINDKLSAIDERIAIMSEPHFHSQDDLIFPPLDDELKTEGD